MISGCLKSEKKTGKTINPAEQAIDPVYEQLKTLTQAELADYFSRINDSEQIKDELFKVRRVAFDQENVLRSDHDQKNILIIDLGMLANGLVAFKHRVSGVYQASESGSAEVLFPAFRGSVPVDTWYTLMFPGKPLDKWPLHTDSMLEMKKSIGYTGGIERDYTEHGDPILNLIGETTRKSNIVIVSDTNGSKSIAKSYNCNLTFEENIRKHREFYKKRDNELINIAEKHNIGYLHASWAINGSAPGCIDQKKRAEFKQFSAKLGNGLFKKFSDMGIVIVQAGKSGDKLVTDTNMETVTKKYPGDCQEIPNRIRVNSIKLSEFDFDNIPKLGQSLTEPDTIDEDWQVKESCIDFLIAQPQSLKSTIGNFLFLPSVVLNFYTINNASSYISPFLTSFIVNMVERGYWKHEEIASELSAYKKVINFKSLPIENWPYHFNEEEKENFQDLLREVQSPEFHRELISF
jgi:hypothetical protein